MVGNHLNIKDVKVENYPYRYICVDDFFKLGFHNEISKDFEEIKARGIVDTFSVDKLSRMGAYDAYSYVIPSDCELGKFIYSRDWKDFISNIFQTETTDHTIAAYHHHKVGSKDGFLHNDYTMHNFNDARNSDGINPWCNNSSYRVTNEQMKASAKYVVGRSIVLLYYFGSHKWVEGDGGETGIFKNGDKKSLVKKINPISNRLFAFEISPMSVHTFFKNYVERNTLIQWFHSDVDYLRNKFGTEPIMW